jgi:hypothetical protein
MINNKIIKKYSKRIVKGILSNKRYREIVREIDREISKRIDKEISRRIAKE